MTDLRRKYTDKRKTGNFENLEPMSHDEAAELGAVELYVLKDLTPEQESRFEGHYFECQECAQAVAVEQTLAEVVPPKTRQWWPKLEWFVWAPATAVLVAIAAFQNFYSIPSLKAQLAQLSEPQANTVITAHKVQMGTDDGQVVKTPSTTVELTLDPASEFPFYRVEISGKGKEAISQIVPAPQDFRLSLHVASETLGSGSFDVLVYGLPKDEPRDGKQVGQYYFYIRKGDANAKPGQ